MNCLKTPQQTFKNYNFLYFYFKKKGTPLKSKYPSNKRSWKFQNHTGSRAWQYHTREIVMQLPNNVLIALTDQYVWIEKPKSFIILRAKLNWEAWKNLGFLVQKRFIQVYVLGSSSIWTFWILNIEYLLLFFCKQAQWKKIEANIQNSFKSMTCRGHWYRIII